MFISTFKKNNMTKKIIVGIPGITGMPPEIPDPILSSVLQKSRKAAQRVKSGHKPSIGTRTRRNLLGKISGQ